ncbi:MAG: FeoB-associated Cys-rich membrane protein [Lachnospiraceae bacterium]
MIDIILVVVIIAILGLSIGYIVRAKKRGVKCIGCSSGSTCSGHCGGSCSCHEEEQ